MAAGCAKVFKEKMSGARSDRPELAKAISKVASGRDPGTSGTAQVRQTFGDVRLEAGLATVH